MERRKYCAEPGSAPPLPNPYEANLASMGGDTGGRTLRCRRAAELSAHARRLLAQCEPAFRLSDLARISGISKQGIHKTYGNRSDVIIAALNDYTLSIYQYGIITSYSSNPVLSFVEAYAEAFQVYPEYFSGTMLITLFDRKGSYIFEKSQIYATELIKDGLQYMKDRHLISDTADLKLAASAIASLTTMESLEWNRNLVRTHQLRGDLTCKVGIFLRGLASDVPTPAREAIQCV